MGTVQESIAYEMAELVRENRELRQEVEKWKSAYEELRFEYVDLKESIRQEKVHEEPVLIDTAECANKYEHVVITVCQGNFPKYDRGFVILVDHVCCGRHGLRTLYGTCLERDEVNKHKGTREVSVRINNKSYGWKRIEEGKMSKLVKTPGGSSEKFCSKEYANGKYVTWHYESEDLMEELVEELPQEEALEV